MNGCDGHFLDGDYWLSDLCASVVDLPTASEAASKHRTAGERTDEPGENAGRV